MTQANDILASVLKNTPTTSVESGTHENTSLETERSNEGENTSNDASASSETNQLDSTKTDDNVIQESVNQMTEQLESKYQLNCHVNKDVFMARVHHILKSKMDSQQLESALADIKSLL
jgi:hypothetical protein